MKLNSWKTFHNRYSFINELVSISGNAGRPKPQKIDRRIRRLGSANPDHPRQNRNNYPLTPRPTAISFDSFSSWFETVEIGWKWLKTRYSITGAIMTGELPELKRAILNPIFIIITKQPCIIVRYEGLSHIFSTVHIQIIHLETIDNGIINPSISVECLPVRPVRPVREH